MSRLERVRRSSALMHNDPYTIVVALDDNVCRIIFVCVSILPTLSL